MRAEVRHTLLRLDDLDLALYMKLFIYLLLPQDYLLILGNLVGMHYYIFCVLPNQVYLTLGRKFVQNLDAGLSKGF